MAIALGDMHDEAQMCARQGIGGPSCLALASAQIAQDAAQLGDRQPGLVFELSDL